MNSLTVLAGNDGCTARTQGTDETSTTGAKSVNGLYGSFGSRCGSTALVPWCPINRVKPFGGDFATKSAAITPFAPVLFSTTMVAPFPRCANTRARVSAEAPAGVGA